MQGTKPAATLNIELPSGDSSQVIFFGGCLGDSYVAIAQSRDRYLSFLKSFLQLQDVVVGATIKATASDTYKLLNKRWSTCMAGGGYKIDDPLSAVGLFPGDTVTPAEVAEASVDLSCKVQVDYERTATELTDAEVRSALERNPGVLEQWQQVEAEIGANLSR